MNDDSNNGWSEGSDNPNEDAEINNQF